MFVLYIVLGVTASIFIVLYLAITTMRRKSQAIIAANFTVEEQVRTVVSANFFGLTSKGKIQMRGNGPMVLTREMLWFKQLMTNTVIELPLADISAMEIRKSHLGKVTPYPLLYVEFTIEGKEDSAAWLMRTPQEWIDAIEELRGESTS